MKISNRVLAIPTFIIISTVSSFLPIQAQDSAKQESAAVMAKEIADLRDQLSKLQTTINERHKNHIATTTKTNTDSASTGGMSMRKGMGKMDMKTMSTPSDPSAMKMDGMDMGTKDMAMGMSMMKKDMGMMDMKTMSMPSDSSAKNKDGMDMGMKMMGKMPNASMNVSALPGFPGASHLYHIGSTGFFLDHQGHIGLSTEQLEKLNQIKEASALEQNEFDRQIERAEEELWTITSAAEPDATAIEKKLADIGVLAGQQRLSYIRAVGKAAKILSEEQRKTLTGHSPSADNPSADSHKGKH